MTSILQKYLNANVNSNKEASNSSVTDAAKFVGTNVLLPLGLAAGAQVLGHKISEYLNRPPKTNPSTIDQVVSIKPNLAAVDPKLLHTYHSIMTQEAPSIMKHPHVAANILERVVNYGGIDHTLLRDLADSQKAISFKHQATAQNVHNVIGNAIAMQKSISMYNSQRNQNKDVEMQKDLKLKELNQRADKLKLRQQDLNKRDLQVAQQNAHKGLELGLKQQELDLKMKQFKLKHPDPPQYPKYI